MLLAFENVIPVPQLPNSTRPFRGREPSSFQAAGALDFAVVAPPMWAMTPDAPLRPDRRVAIRRADSDARKRDCG